MKDQFTIETTFQGAIRISTVHNGQYISRQFFFYELEEALEEFESQLESESREPIDWFSGIRNS